MKLVTDYGKKNCNETLLLHQGITFTEVTALKVQLKKHASVCMILKDSSFNAF